MRSDNERSLLSLIERVTNSLTGVELVQTTSPEGDHQASGLAEVGVREIKAQTRILTSQLQERLGSRSDEKNPLMSWIPRHGANCVSRYRIMDDGRTPDQRRCGKTWKSPVVEFGESVHFRPVGENSAMRGTKDGIACSSQRVLEFHGFLRPDQRSLVRPVVPAAEAEQGVAHVIVMPAVPNTDRRRYVTKEDLVKLGYTDECQPCTQLVSGMHNAKVLHDDRCRDRIGELMAEDDDQRQVERVTARTVSEVEIPCPEAREEMDVGEPSVQPQSVHEEDQPQPVPKSASQPVPTVRVGGSSS